MALRTFSFAASVALGMVAVAGTTPAVAASADYLLKLDTIPGESAAQKPAGASDWIDVTSLHFRGGVDVASGDVNGDGKADTGRSSGKRQHTRAGSATLAAPGDQQAALLLPAVQKVREAAARMGAWPGCTAGQRLGGVHIKVVKTGRTGQILDATVSACAADSVSLNFTKIKWD